MDKQALRFGVFMSPSHVAGENPTLNLEEDLALLTEIDRLGYDEAWVGEHHSAGHEIIASPEIFIAAAAARTRRIRLGTGVVSAAYHHPLWVAERAVLLDHLTRGRFMLGLGPGTVPTDAAMIGLDMPGTRPLFDDAVAVIMALLRSDEPVTFRNHRWTLEEARLHLRPYSRPHMEVAVAAAVSPAGPRLAGRYGLGLLSIGATTKVGFDLLGIHWAVVTERAAHYGTTADRSAWRLLSLVHIAETREQAYRDVEHNIVPFFDYFQRVVAFPQFNVGYGSSPAEHIDFINDSGVGSIGTVDDACAHIERIWEQSNGGFGCFLQLIHNWATPDRQRRSYELFARHVMPRFQGQAQSTLDAAARASAQHDVDAGSNLQAVQDSRALYDAEVQEFRRDR